MNDPSQQTKLKRASELTQARTAGRWIPWATVVLAVFWWGSVSVGVAYGVDLSALWAASPEAVIAGAIAATLPGFVLILAGVMAQESRRSARANAIVLEAADALLAPAETAAEDTERLSSVVLTAADRINHTMTEAARTLGGLSKSIGDERLRLESVTYAATDNGRELADRLGEERKALETLARELRGQTEAMSEAIPRQARAMVDAAREASAEVAQSETALDARLKTLSEANEALRARLHELDRIAETASSRAQALDSVATRIEDKLNGARHTIDAAGKASDMAASAAGAAGDRLRDAVSAALDGARRATAEISEASRNAAKEASETLAKLEAAGKRSAEAASLMSRSAAEAPATAAPQPPPRSPAPSVSPPQTVKPTPRPEIKRERAVLPPQAPPSAAFASPPPKAQPAPSAPLNEDDDDLFESDAPKALKANRPPIAPPPPQSTEPAFSPKDGLTTGPDRETAAWRDILADMDKDRTASADVDQLDGQPREETAEELINRLETSGIKLPQAFKPKDKKKIAAASKIGDAERRSTTRSVAGREVDRVSVRLRKDDELKLLAKTFLIQEADDALRALQQTQNSGRFASPRLSAYLLVDAALS